MRERPGTSTSRRGVASPSPEVRRAARLLLFDAEGRVLLLRHRDDQGHDFWAPPGGGLEPGESLEQAARREALEELGVAVESLEPLWTSRVLFEFAGRRVSQTETLFLAESASRVGSAAPTPGGRREGIVEMRWWPLDALAASERPVYPRDLARRVRARLARRETP